MDVHQMRYLVKQAYSGKKWKQKVDNMSDGQVTALYYSLARRGKFGGTPI